MTAPDLFTPEQVAARLSADGHITADWIITQLRTKKWQGRKIGRRWYLTEADIQANLDRAFSAATPPPAPPASGVSPRSRRRKRTAA